jgi:hypothetical protein
VNNQKESSDCLLTQSMLRLPKCEDHEVSRADSCYALNWLSAGIIKRY